MYKITLIRKLLFISLFFALCLTSCSFFKGTLNIEAAIVYKVGGSQPLARVKFYLLDQDLEQIFKEAGDTEDERYNENIKKWEKHKRPFKVDDLITFQNNPYLFEEEQSRLKSAIAEHIKYTVETDFQGKAQLSNIETGIYYLYGITDTRGGTALWNLRLEIKNGSNSVMLDQNNALEAF